MPYHLKFDIDFGRVALCGFVETSHYFVALSAIKWCTDNRLIDYLIILLHYYNLIFFIVLFSRKYSGFTFLSRTTCFSILFINTRSLFLNYGWTPFHTIVKYWEDFRFKYIFILKSIAISEVTKLFLYCIISVLFKFRNAVIVRAY